MEAATAEGSPSVEDTDSKQRRSTSMNSMNEVASHPFFYYHNTTHSQTSTYFSLHSNSRPNPNNSAALYSNNYGTTLTIIILLHVIYFLQWNGRRSRRELCTSYEQLVEKKLFYKAVIAIASHPPVDGGESSRNTMNVDDLELHRLAADNEGVGSRSWVSVATILSRRCGVIRGMSAINRRIFAFGTLIYQSILHPFIHGSLSGLPLLAFTSHILWQCRALEELYDGYDGKLILGVNADTNQTQFIKLSAVATEVRYMDDSSNNEPTLAVDVGYTYLRVLVALAFTSILLELMLLRMTVKRNEFLPRQHRRERAMCSTASLATAILGVYNSRFPFSPPPVLPFIKVSFLSASGFSYLFSILILTVLTRKINLATSVFSGMLSGLLWSLGLTSFLATRYWGNAVLLSLTLATLLSLKSQPMYSKYLEIIVPCFDYVAWDGFGSTNDDHRDVTNGSDIEMGSRTQTQNGDLHSQERFPLLLSESSSMGDGDGSGSVIRGRVPLINSMESDVDGAEDLISNDETIPSASPRFGTSVLRRPGAGNE